MITQEEWQAPCPACQMYVLVRYDKTDVVEYVETNRYGCRYTCPVCEQLLEFEINHVGARFGLNHGSRHCIVMKVGEEEHQGGDPINEDDQIDFFQAFQPGPDENPDAVYDRIWQELSEA